MSDQQNPPAGKGLPKPRAKGADEKVGRALGKAFGRLKRTKIWQDTSRAYREGLEEEKTER
jgi:ribosomal protein L19E